MRNMDEQDLLNKVTWMTEKTKGKNRSNHKIFLKNEECGRISNYVQFLKNND